MTQMTPRRLVGISLTFLPAVLLLVAMLRLPQRQSSERSPPETERLRSLLAWQYTANGLQALESGSLHESLPWFVESLALHEHNPFESEIDRIRIGTCIRQSPRLDQVLRADEDLTLGELTSDGRRVVAAGHKIYVWNAENGQQAYSSLVQEPASLPVDQLALSPNGRLLASAKLDSIALWELATGRLIAKIAVKGTVVRLLFDRAGNRFLAMWRRGGANRAPESEAGIFRADTGEAASPVINAPNSWTTGAADFSPDGTMVALVLDESVKIFATRKWSELERPKELDNGESIVALSFASEWVTGKLLIAGDMGHFVRVNPANPLERGYSSYSVRAEPTVLAVDWKHQSIFCAGAQGYVHSIWGWPIRNWPISGGPLIFAEYAADGLWLITVNSDGTVNVLDASNSHSVYARFPRSRLARTTGDGRHLLTVTQDGMAKLWDLTPQDPCQPVDGAHWNEPHAEYSTGGSGTTAITPDGKRILLGFPSRLEIRDLETGNLLAPFINCAAKVGIQFSRTLPTALIWDNAERGSDKHQFSAQLLDSSTGRWVEPSVNLTGPLRDADVDRRRGLLLEPDDDDKHTIVSICDLTDGHVIARHRWDGEFTAGKLSPDGQHFYLRQFEGTPIRAGDVDSAQPVSQSFEPDVLTITFDRDATRLLKIHQREGDRDQPELHPGALDVWSAKSGKLLHRLPGSSYLGAALSPDGRRVVACDAMKFQIWDVETGRPISNSFGLRPDGNAPGRLGINFSFQIIPQKTFDETIFTDEDQWAEFRGDGGIVATNWPDLGIRLWVAQSGEAITPPTHFGSTRFVVDWKDHKLVSQFGGEVSIRSFAPDNRPFSDLTIWARLLSGNKIDERGGIKHLDPDEYYQLWQSRPPLPPFRNDREHVWRSFLLSRWRGDTKENLGYLINSQPDRWELYARRARENETEKAWNAMLPDLDQAIELQPTLFSLRYWRGDILAKLGRWPAASTDFVKAIELGMIDAAPEAAMTLLESGDRAAYRRFRKSILERLKADEVFREASLVNETNRLCEACLFDSVEADDFAPVIACMTRLIANEEESRAFYRMTLGAAYYRAGRFNDAINYLTLAQSADRTPETWIWLAMAEHASHHVDAEMMWRKKAIDWLENPSNTENLKWNKRLGLRILRRELEQLR
jgi:WD40 repeat protein/tetratricopeptide (TPR) repeat protein